jgi:hypothetical protein
MLWLAFYFCCCCCCAVMQVADFDKKQTGLDQYAIAFSHPRSYAAAAAAAAGAGAAAAAAAGNQVADFGKKQTGLDQYAIALAHSHSSAAAAAAVTANQVADFGKKQTGLDQYAIARFAEALEVVPRTIAENSGLPASEVLARLYAAHTAGQVGIVVAIMCCISDCDSRGCVFWVRYVDRVSASQGMQRDQQQAGCFRWCGQRWCRALLQRIAASQQAKCWHASMEHTQQAR